MTPVELSRTVLHAVRCAVDQGELSVTVPERAVVTVPGPGGCGDYATNIALQLARLAGQPPLRVAEVLRTHLARSAGVTGVDISGPGFLNISLDRDAASVELVRRILREQLRYGHSRALDGHVIPLRIPYDVRAEVLADVLVRIVGTQGGRVEVEHGEPVNLRPVPAPEDPAPLGPDAARWALLHPAPHDRPRITADHLVQRESNPLFRVRYAHARTQAVLRNAADLGFGPESGPLAADDGDAVSDRGFGPQPGRLLAADESEATDLGPGRPLTADAGPGSSPIAPPPAPTHLPGAHLPSLHPAANATPPSSPHGAPTTPPPSPAEHLLATLADHPRILSTAVTRSRHLAAGPTADPASRPTVDTNAASRPTVDPDAPSRLTRHLVTLADATLTFLPTVLPRGEEKPSAAHRARLALAEAAGTVLAGGLFLLGIDAPRHL